MDVLPDGTGIETAGWFRSSRNEAERSDETIVMSRLCALHWVIVLYDSVVPDPLKADVSIPGLVCFSPIIKGCVRALTPAPVLVRPRVCFRYNSSTCAQSSRSHSIQEPGSAG